jgi:hypothetical protein
VSRDHKRIFSSLFKGNTYFVIGCILAFVLFLYLKQASFSMQIGLVQHYYKITFVDLLMVLLIIWYGTQILPFLYDKEILSEDAILRWTEEKEHA